MTLNRTVVILAKWICLFLIFAIEKGQCQDIADPRAVRIEGKVLDPTSVQRAQRIPLQSIPVSHAAYPNLKKSIPSTTKQVPQNLHKMIPGLDGVPQYITIVGGEIVVKALNPRPVSAQPPRVKDASIADLQYLDIDQGMISSYVWCLMEDSKGNLWIGTNAGISCYDGTTFRHYTMKEGLSSNRARCILEDSRGHLWFGTDGGGVCKYDGEKFVHFTESEGLSDNHVFSILEDNRGHLWFGTRGGTVSRMVMNEDQPVITHYRLQVGSQAYPVWSMKQDSKGDLWFATLGGGLSRFDGSGFVNYGLDEGMSSNEIWTILEDSEGALWVGTNGSGVCIIEDDEGGDKMISQYSESGMEGRAIWSILEDAQKNIWLGYEGGGVSRFRRESDGSGGVFANYSIGEGLSSDRVKSMIIGSQGIIWLGTRGGGINRFDPASFLHFGKNQGLSDNTIWSMAEDREGHLWFGTESGGVNHYDGSTFKHFSIGEGLSDDEVTSIIQDRDGNMWFGTQWGGVTVFDGDEFIHLTTDEGLSCNQVQALCQDRQGHIWIGTQGGGVCRYDLSKGIDEGIFTHYTEAEGLSNNTIRAILEDAQGNLWFGTQGGGVIQFVGDGSYAGGAITTYSTENGLSHSRVWAIHEDSKGQIWFGTQGGGLSRFDGHNFTSYNTAHGLSHDWVWSIIEDDEQRIWTSTERGISVLVPLEPDGVEEVNDHTLNFQCFTFGRKDGLKRLDFSQNGCLDQQNRMWWGSIEGLTMLDLDRFDLPSDTPKIRMKTIGINQNFIDYRNLSDPNFRSELIDGETIYKSIDSILPFHNYPITMELPHNLNHITFHFTAIDWSAPHKLQYAYLLEGWDEEWSIPSKETSATYRNLSPGNYNFKVRALGKAQIWSDPITYAFSIRPPWWFSWPAMGFYLLGGVSLIFGFIRFRTADLMRQHKELEQTVADRTAEVIAQTSELIAQRNRSEELLLNILPPEVAEELKETGHTKPVIFEEVSILFADFKEFTNIVASIPGKKLVQELDDIFQHFDDIIVEGGLEKIQTVGDAYLAVAGLPREVPDHAKKCVATAKNMIDYLKARNANSAIKWKLRIGIHSGPVTAGVVGKRKFSYDIFGDTVNIAARIESSSEVGQINVSAYTYDLIRDSYDCEYRGKINAKGKGNLDMYFVK